MFLFSVTFLITIISSIINSYLEILSELVAGIRYEKEGYAWKKEQEQWLLLLDLINTSKTLGEVKIRVDDSICGKEQPLTIKNRRKLNFMGYSVDEKESKISLTSLWLFHV